MKKLFNTSLIHLKNKSGIYLIKIERHLYVGSSINIYDRLNNHKQRLNNQKHINPYFLNCFNKYGKDMCDYKILEYCKKEDLLIKESQWIKHYNSDLNMKDPLTEQNSKSQSKIVYRYDLDGNFIDEWASVSEASRSLTIDHRSISACARGKKENKSAGNFMWSYEKNKTIPKYINNSSKAVNKNVTMYTPEGVKIKTFNSIAECAREIISELDDFDSSCASISSICNKKGKFFKDYTFSFEDKDIIDLNLSRNYKIKRIINDTEFIIYDNFIDAAEKTGNPVAGIRKAVRENKIYKGEK